VGDDGSPWPSASKFFEFHLNSTKKKVKKLENSRRADLKRGGDLLTSLTENLATPHKITYKIVHPTPPPRNLKLKKKKKKNKNPVPTYLLNLHLVVG